MTKKLSKEQIKKRTESRRKNGWWKNPEKTKIKQSKAISGEKNYGWKGDKAKKCALHKWLRKHKQKAEVCEICGKKKKLDLANIRNHIYTRNPDDYKWYCHKCHKKMDFKKDIKRDKNGRFAKIFKKNMK